LWLDGQVQIAFYIPEESIRERERNAAVTLARNDGQGESHGELYRGRAHGGALGHKVLNCRGRRLDQERQGRDSQELAVQEFPCLLFGLVGDPRGQPCRRRAQLRPVALSGEFVKAGGELSADGIFPWASSSNPFEAGAENWFSSDIQSLDYFKAPRSKKLFRIKNL
jgi:hypothetical protein